MFSFVKHIYNLFDVEYRKEQLSKKLQLEDDKFEESLREEEENVLKQKQIKEKQEAPSEDKLKCVKRTGVITGIRSNEGVIDGTHSFDYKSSKNFDSLKVGCTVEYILYKPNEKEKAQVKQICLVQEAPWDEEQDEKKIAEAIEKNSGDTGFFSTHQRSILGLIVSRNHQFLTVDTDYKEITVDLDSVSIDFTPKEGDRIYLNCNVQTDEDFADQAGEILETKSIHPARTKVEEGTITKMHEDWGVINTNCYFTMDVLAKNMKLAEGDVVKGNMIECERGIFIWRCLKIEFLRQGARVKKENENGKHFQAVEITDNIHSHFDNAFESKELEIRLKNNSDRSLTLLKVEVVGPRRNTQISLEKINVPVTLETKTTTKLIIVCNSRFYGSAKEKLAFIFANFRIHRQVDISVGVKDSKTNETKNSTPHRKSRQYAHEVWTKKVSSIPGVKAYTARRFVAVRIGSYDVPLQLRSALLTSKNRNDQIVKVEHLYPCLTAPLCIETYTARFQTLLYIEEVEQFVNFRHYDRERAHLTREGEFLALEIENLAEKRPSLVLGDTIRITNPWKKDAADQAFEGCIHKVLNNKILIKFNEAFHHSYNGEDYKMEFFFSRYNFRKQHHSLQKIVPKKGEVLLFPSKVIESKKLQLDAVLTKDGELMVNGTESKQWCNENLNMVQKSAVVNILRGEARSMPYVIFGPPGTGKTITLVETVLQLLLNLPHSRIIVATPSNSSADLIATRLIDSGFVKPGDFVRLVSQRVVDKDTIPDNIKPYCVTADIAAENSVEDGMKTLESGLKLRCQMKYIGRHKITIGTCSSLGTLLQMAFPEDHFTHLIVDESGQCSEPEIMAPICLLSASSGQVILAGDPCQLGPLIVNNLASERGLKVSFLERLIERAPYKRDKSLFPTTGRDPRLVTKLIYNYRALPSILEVYSDLFYDSELLPMLKTEGNKECKLLESISCIFPPSNKRPASHATFFHGIKGQNKQDADSPSWYNPIEAKHIFSVVVKLYNLKITAPQIGIITPYQKQVRILRALFLEANIDMPKIGSVEEFQGQERDIILISTVRSSKDFLNVDLKYAIGFACSPKRMNVAISRARALLYICGNPHLLALTDSWRDLIKRCIENDAYIGCDLPEIFEIE